MTMRPEGWGGDHMLLHWLTRPNARLSGTRPADRLGDEGEAVL